MKKVLYLLLFIAMISCSKENPKSELSKVNKYAISKYPTPVLCTKNFEEVYGGNDGNTLKRSDNGLIKELEYVAYPGSSFEILEVYNTGDHKIFKVYSDEYDIPELGIELFIDSRFVEVTSDKPDERKIVLPSKQKIYEFFDKSIEALYIWGANNINGVDEMFEYYKPSGKLSDKERNEWGLKGTDCSGLIYEATNGYTPRHTYQLVYFGDPVIIEGLTASQIANKLEPLDLIVWKGHVIIVYDRNTTIESAMSAGGVVKKNLRSVIEKLMRNRQPINKWIGGKRKAFVIRRWYNKDF